MTVIPFPAAAPKAVEPAEPRDLADAFHSVLLASWLVVTVAVFLVRF